MTHAPHTARRWALLPVFALALAGCGLFGGEDEDENARVVVAFELDQNRVYAWSQSTVTSDGAVISSVRDTIAARVVRMDDEMASYSNLIRIDVFSQREPEIVATTWFRPTEATLFESAYRNAGGPNVLPKRPAGNRPSPEVLTLPALVRPLVGKAGVASTREEETIVRTEERIVYQYPLEAGRKWTAFSDPFLQTREVLGIEEVTVLAGTFRCAKIRTTLPVFEETSIEWIDYVAAEGLVLRTVKQQLDVAESIERVELIRKNP